jgi:hypothetical protein
VQVAVGGAVTWQELVVAAVQVVLVAASVFYLARQVRAERRAISFQVYSQVSDGYVRLGSSTTDHPELNSVWEPWEAARLTELRTAQTTGAAAGVPWAAWRTMNEQEKRCYRYTREVVEVLEQAWQLREADLISAETYAKWSRAGSMWKTSRYYEFVLTDTSPRLLPGFCAALDALPPTTD